EAQEITQFARGDNYSDRNKPPFDGASFQMKTLAGGRLLFGGWTDGGNKHQVQIRLRKFPKDTDVTISLLYLIHPPIGEKPQWLLKVSTPQEEDLFYKFTEGGNYLAQIDLTPQGYITQFARGGIYSNPNHPTFLGSSFQMKTVAFVFRAVIGGMGNLATAATHNC
ncbi:MAG: hypothetical protein IH899_17710, partial [Planctomycetes bacterium]|nr:hypothetical protein [Planctomycetota bacterium]